MQGTAIQLVLSTRRCIYLGVMKKNLTDFLMIFTHTALKQTYGSSYTLRYLRVIGLKILGRVGTHIFFFCSFFPRKNIILCILKGISPFKMHKIKFFQKT